MVDTAVEQQADGRPPASPVTGPYRQLVQQAGHLLWTLTADGIVDAEQGWCPFTGQSAAEAQGWGWLAAVHPDDRERVRQEWAGVLAGRDHYESVYRLRCADGAYSTLLVRAMPAPEPDGGVHRWAAFGTDVTAHEEVAAALRASEEARQVHEERLRTVVANAPIVLFAVDGDGVFTLSQGRGLEALGIAPDAHVGQSYFTLYRDLTESIATMRRVLAGEAATTVERFRGLVFETRWMPTIAADGTVTGVIGVSADITARAQAQEERDALLQSERQARAQAAEQVATLAATFDAITDGILIYDRDGRLVHANAAAHTANAWAAQPGYPNHPPGERAALALPRDATGRELAREEWPVSRVLRGEVLTGEEAVDTLVRQPDGRDVLLSVSGSPIYDAEGRIVGGVIVDRDVTERRRLEQRTREALDALLEMARTLVTPHEDEEAADDAGAPTSARVERVGRRLVELTRRVLGCQRLSMVTIEPRTGIQHPLAAVGLTPEEERLWRGATTGTSLFAAQDPFRSAIVARIRSGEVFVLDMTQPPLDANPYGVRSLLVAPMHIGDDLVGLYSLDYGADGHTYTADELALAGAVAQLAALTIERERLLREREEARASALALRAANQRMDEFLGVASHELRTPLTGLRGSLQLMQRRLERIAGGGEDDTPAAELGVVLSRLSPFLERALHQSRVLAGLVDDLLDLSRIRAGQLQLRLVPRDLAALVGQTVEERRALEAARTITLDLPRQPVMADADAERLAQVVDHYLDNALKYSAVDQPVAVRVAADGAMVQVSVRDMGPGIAPAEQERIWDRFYQPAGTEHRSGSSVGLGLGLYLSRTIVERHGGHVGVESMAGAGASFWFRLPRSEPLDATG